MPFSFLDLSNRQSNSIEGSVSSGTPHPLAKCNKVASWFGVGEVKVLAWLVPLVGARIDRIQRSFAFYTLTSKLRLDIMSQGEKGQRKSRPFQSSESCVRYSFCSHKLEIKCSFWHSGNCVWSLINIWKCKFEIKCSF